MVSDALSRSDDDSDTDEDEATLEGTSPLERAVRMPAYPYDENTDGHDLPGGVVREPSAPAPTEDDEAREDEDRSRDAGARQLTDEERASQQQATSG